MLKIIPNELIDTRSKNLGSAACSKNHFVVNGKGDVHITHITCARKACQVVAATVVAATVAADGTAAVALTADEGRGLVICELQEGRGIGLMNKLRAYELQDQGADTVEANVRLGFDSGLRSYALPGEILRYFGLQAVRLLSNNPDKVEAVERAGVEVVERVHCLTDALESREAYMLTKKEKMGHLLE